jgi:hypothetical protein
MWRICSNCHHPFAPQDFVKEESRGMEAERRAFGLQGLRFLYYSCPVCRHDDIFVDIHPLDGETEEEFQARREDMENAARQIHGEGVDVVVTTR